MIFLETPELHVAATGVAARRVEGRRMRRGAKRSGVECTCTRTCSTPAAILKLGRALPTAHLQRSVRVPADTSECRPCISSDAGVHGGNGGQEWRNHLAVEAKALFRTGARLTGAKKPCADERSINAMVILIPMCVCCCILCLPMLFAGMLVVLHSACHRTHTKRVAKRGSFTNAIQKRHYYDR